MYHITVLNLHTTIFKGIPNESFRGMGQSLKIPAEIAENFENSQLKVPKMLEIIELRVLHNFKVFIQSF